MILAGNLWSVIATVEYLFHDYNQNEDDIMRRTTVAVAIAASMLLSTSALARDIRVEITNLTDATFFTPVLVAAMERDTHLFEAGSEASDSLQAMAEGGELSGLIDEVVDAGGIYMVTPDDELLGPGEQTSVELDVRGRRHASLSIAAMVLPSNDGFVGLDALEIPRKHGRHVYYLNAYDAGTELNDEIINGGGAPGVPGIPADPGGHGGIYASGADAGTENPKVHIHPGILGDTDPTGGPSDLDSRIHRWMNPVAKVVIEVTK